MKLTFEDIKKITIGSIKTVETEKGIEFFKCTEKQIEAFKAKSEGFYKRSLATTGIRLDFVTNSEFVEFVVGEGHYELFVDELLVKQYTSEEDIADKYELDGKEHRVTLYLPCHEWGVVKSLSLSDGAEFKRPKFDTKILFIGDSITEGYNSGKDSMCFSHVVSRHFNADSLIQAVGGAYYDVTTFDADVDFEPDTVFVAYGTNDWGMYKDYDLFYKNLCEHLDLLLERYKGKKFYGITPIWRVNVNEEKEIGVTFAELREVIRKELEKRGIIHLDGYKMVPHSAEYFEDNVHPNAEGFYQYSINILKEIDRASKL
jgi:lysophospholipase L1-like esterase